MIICTGYVKADQIKFKKAVTFAAAFLLEKTIRLSCVMV